MLTPDALFPFKVERPIPFAHIEKGEVFFVDKYKYKLLSRDAFSVRLIQWFSIYEWVYRLFGRKVVYSREQVR